MCTEMIQYFEKLPATNRSFSSLARHLRNCDYNEYRDFGMLVGKMYYTVDFYIGKEKSQYIIATFDVSEQKFADSRTFSSDRVDAKSIKTLIHFNTTAAIYQKHGKAFMDEMVLRYVQDLVIEEQLKVCNAFVENEDFGEVELVTEPELETEDA